MKEIDVVNQPFTWNCPGYDKTSQQYCVGNLYSDLHFGMKAILDMRDGGVWIFLVHQCTPQMGPLKSNMIKLTRGYGATHVLMYRIVKAYRSC